MMSRGCHFAGGLSKKKLSHTTVELGESLPYCHRFPLKNNEKSVMVGLVNLSLANTNFGLAQTK